MPIAFPSGDLSTSQLVRSGQGLVTHIQGGDQAVTVYDSTTASGTVIATVGAFENVDYPNPQQFKNGIFSSVASTTSDTGAVIHLV